MAKQLWRPAHRGGARDRCGPQIRTLVASTLRPITAMTSTARPGRPRHPMASALAPGRPWDSWCRWSTSCASGICRQSADPALLDNDTNPWAPMEAIAQLLAFSKQARDRLMRCAFPRSSFDRADTTVHPVSAEICPVVSRRGGQAHCLVRADRARDVRCGDRCGDRRCHRLRTGAGSG